MGKAPPPEQGAGRREQGAVPLPQTHTGRMASLESQSVSFSVDGKSQPQGSIKAIPRGDGEFPLLTSDNPNLKSWRQVVAIAAMNARAGFYVEEGPVWLEVRFRLTRPKSLPKRVVRPVKKPDLDKLVRAVLDALTGVVYRDDSQVVSIHAQKAFCEEGTAPGAWIEVRG